MPENMKISTAINLLFLLCSTLIFGQTKVHEKSTLTIDAQQFWGFDAFGYVYYSKENVLTKEKNNERFQYKNLNLGTLKNVDLRNPLRLLLFFETFNSITTLDNQLNEIQTIDFSMGNPPMNIVATGMAAQNQIWCFDNLSQKIWLYHFNQRKAKAISVQMTQKIKAYASNLNYFYLIDEKNNIFQINIFGKITTLGAINDFRKIQFVNDENILLQNENGLSFQNLTSGKIQPLNIEEKRIESFYIQDQILSIFTGKEIINYTIILP
jgi:hypothetical protein